MDKVWYQTVISSCGLERDITRLRQGDQTPVAGNGMTLSGGQKQRIVSENDLVNANNLGILVLTLICNSRHWRELSTLEAGLFC